MSEALFTALGKAFRCQVYGVKPRRNVFVVRTNRGVWVVKGYDERERAEWVTGVARALRERGFARTVHYLTAKDGSEVLSLGSSHYTVMKAIEGKEAVYSSREDIRQAAATLARFHRAAQGFPPLTPMYGRVPPIVDKWESRLSHFEEIVQKIERRGPHNRFEQLVLDLAPEVRELGRAVLDEAFQLPLIAEMHQAIEAGTLAHRDVASHNFLITPRRHCYLIDLDTVSHDMQLVDLVQFASRMLLMQGYSMDAFAEAMDAYIKVHPLSDTQIWMIHRLLRYPDNVLREVTGVYARRPGYRVRGVMQLLQLERRHRQERHRFIESENGIISRVTWKTYNRVG